MLAVNCWLLNFAELNANNAPAHFRFLWPTTRSKVVSSSSRWSFALIRQWAADLQMKIMDLCLADGCPIAAKVRLHINVASRADFQGKLWLIHCLFLCYLSEPSASNIFVLIFKSHAAAEIPKSLKRVAWNSSALMHFWLWCCEIINNLKAEPDLGQSGLQTIFCLRAHSALMMHMKYWRFRR